MHTYYMNACTLLFCRQRNRGMYDAHKAPCPSCSSCHLSLLVVLLEVGLLQLSLHLFPFLARGTASCQMQGKANMHPQSLQGHLKGWVISAWPQLDPSSRGKQITIEHKEAVLVHRNDAVLSRSNLSTCPATNV